MSTLFGVADERPVSVTFYGGPNDGLLQTMTHPLPEVLHVAIPAVHTLLDPPPERMPLGLTGTYLLVRGTSHYRWAGER